MRATGKHSAIELQSAELGAFPPNTLFRLREIREPGDAGGPERGVWTEVKCVGRVSIGDPEGTLDSISKLAAHVTLLYDDAVDEAADGEHERLEMHALREGEKGGL